MNLDKVKKDIEKYLYEEHKFIYIGSRNQVEEFKGKISNLYPAIFIIITSEGMYKSFTYSDFAIGNLKIVS